MSDGHLVHDFGRVAPSVKKSEWHAYNRVAWSPDGARLACPGRNNDCVLFSRQAGQPEPPAEAAGDEAAPPAPDSWTEAARLKGGHLGDVSLLAFSPNGLYLATAGMEKALLVWDLRATPAPAVVRHLKVPDDMTGLEWRSAPASEANALAVLLYDGQVTLWAAPVPRRLPPPSVALEDIDLSGYDAGALVDDSAVDADGDADGDEDEGGDTADDEDEEDASDGEGEPGDRKGGKQRVKKRIVMVPAPPPPAPEAQGPIQAGSTPFGGSPRRRFLAYNMLGAVTCRDDGAVQYVEVHFHDTDARLPRLAGHTDYTGISVAALGHAGVIMASSSSSSGGPGGILTCRPVDAWAGPAEWTLPLPPGESPLALAAGASFFAAVTSRRLVRLFTPMGMQTTMLSLDGDVVAASGHGSLLALVWHAAPPEGPPPTSEQRLRYMLLDTTQGTRLCEGPMPLSPAARLSWLGFSDDGCLAAADSTGVLRLRGSAFGGCWMPVFDSTTARASDAERHWHVGLSSSEVYAVVVKAPDTCPTVSSRPVLSIFPLAMPVLRAPDASGADTAAMEDALLRAQLWAQEAAVAAAQHAAGMGDGASSLDVNATVVTLNKALLTLFNAAVKAQRPGRAAELVQRMSHGFALEGALRIANAARSVALAERIAHIIAARGALQVQAAGEHAAVAEYAATAAAVAPSQGGTLASAQYPGDKFARKPQAPVARDENAGPVAEAPKVGSKRDASGDAPAPSKRAAVAGGGANPFARRTG